MTTHPKVAVEARAREVLAAELDKCGLLKMPEWCQDVAVNAMLAFAPPPADQVRGKEAGFNAALRAIIGFADGFSECDTKRCLMAAAADLEGNRAAIIASIEPSDAASATCKPGLEGAGSIGGLVDIVRKHTVVGGYPNTHGIAAEAFELGRAAGENATQPARLVREAWEIVRQIGSMQGHGHAQTYWFAKARDLAAFLTPSPDGSGE